jgi:hypothetical protein
MSADEIAARSCLLLKKQAWKRRGSWTAPKPCGSQQDTWQFSPSIESLRQECEAVVAEAERYLRGEYRMLNLSFQESPLDWHRDPQTGRRALFEFGLGLDFLDPRLVGNIKYVWEKNRHHHLTLLALAWALTKQDRFANEIQAQLRDWVKHNPFPLGINWASSLELGIRLISWVWIERLLRGSAVHPSLFGSEGALWSAIYWHQWMVAKNHSHGSSANNHIVGEMAGLFVAASVWPAFGDSKHWQELSRKMLEREIIKQTFPSGINRELAFSYHIFSLEFFLLALAEAERCAAPFSDAYRARLTRMLEIMPQLMDSGGNLPRFGDGDEGMAVQLQAPTERCDGWLYRVGRALVGAKVPTLKGGALAAAILGFDSVPKAEWMPERDSVGFEDAGIYVLTFDRATPREVFVLADAGPHGYLSTAAHAHADALSFTVSVGGEPILIDPGTFDYLMDEHWRSYFRSTRAHNTLVVDDLDQSTQAGLFLWAQKARTTVHSWKVTDSGAHLVASHDGYAGVGVIHQRSLELHGDVVTVLDTLRGSGEHRVMLCFHTAPECRVERLAPTVLMISRDGVQVRLTVSGDLAVEIVRGGQNAGWYSSGYGLKQETFSIFAHMRGPVPASFKTVLEIHHEN